MESIFVLFDRETESVWYPGADGALNAVSGPRKGDSLPPVAKAEILPMNAWLERHPDSKILLPTPVSKTVHPARNGDDGSGITTLRGKPIVEKDGKTLVWALGDPASDEAKWFDMTDATIDPKMFDHGLGVDQIPSLDEPTFITKEDSRYGKDDLEETARVIGVFAEGEAKAYPINIMDAHELVNDSFGEAHLTVAW